MFRIVKEKKVRFWKDYFLLGFIVDIKDKIFSGKVRNFEFCNGSKKFCISNIFFILYYFNGILDIENLFCFYIYNYVIMLRRVFV